MTDDNFLKQTRSDFCLWLLINHLNAFKLLTVIAHRARRYDGMPDGLKIGYAKIGDWNTLKMTRGEYRHALKVLCDLNLILIIDTNRKRQKATTGTTTEGTLVKILDTRVYDINPESNNHSNNHRTTTEQPLNNHEQERTRKKKKEKEKDITPKPPIALPPLFACLSSFNLIDEKDKHTLMSRFDEIVLIACVDYINNYKKPIGSIMGLMIRYCEDYYKKEKEKEDFFKINVLFTKNTKARVKQHCDLKVFKQKSGEAFILIGNDEESAEEISLYEQPYIFSQRLECSLRKTEQWYSEINNVAHS